MNPNSISDRHKPWQRRPYQVLGPAILLAFIFNVARDNLLWAAYSIVGMALVVLIGYFDAKKWHLPNRLLWWAGVPFAMHYLGGSLSGLHQIGGVNGLYFAFPWWDNLVHFLASAAVGAASVYVLSKHPLEKRTLVFLATTIGTFSGVLIELYEFVGFIYFGTIDQGYYTNTVLDLYYNVLGALAGGWGFANAHVSSRPARELASKT